LLRQGFGPTARFFEFHTPASADDAAAAAAMRVWLRARSRSTKTPILTQSPNLSALQMVAGNFSAAYESRQALRIGAAAWPGRPVGRDLIFDMYARAKAMEAESRVSFAEGFTQAYRTRCPAQ